MLPIHVMYDSGLEEIEEVALMAALQKLQASIPELTISNYGSMPWCHGNYSSADWYVQHTEIIRGTNGELQLNADHLLDLVASEPWQQNPHIDIVLTSCDMTAFDAGQQLNFVFGIADGRISIQSVARFRDCSNFDRSIAIKNVIWHELGHILGMAANTRRSHTEYKLGPHCTNFGCTMRQGMTVSEWIDNARATYQVGSIYCPECMNDFLVAQHVA